MKKCFKCKIEKELDEFYPHKQMADGHLNKCRDCARKDSALQLERNKLDPKWVEKEKERVRLKQLKYAKHPRTQIYKEMRAALSAGTITQKPCEICGKEKSEGHHEDYSKPLDLIWFCKRHHADRHLHLKQAKRKKVEPMPINYYIQAIKAIMPNNL